MKNTTHQRIDQRVAVIKKLFVHDEKRWKNTPPVEQNISTLWILWISHFEKDDCFYDWEWKKKIDRARTHARWGDPQFVLFWHSSFNAIRFLFLTAEIAKGKDDRSLTVAIHQSQANLHTSNGIFLNIRQYWTRIF